MGCLYGQLRREEGRKGGREPWILSDFEVCVEEKNT